MAAIKEVIKQKRLPVLFIGSGISKRYLRNSPTWHDLLEESYSLLDKGDILFAQQIDICRRNRLDQFETYQYLGTKIEELYNDKFYNDLRSSNKEVPKWVKSNISPYKMYLRSRFKGLNYRDNGYLQKELRLFRQLHNKISAVITTNYDQLLEKDIFNESGGFDTYFRQSDLFKSERFNIAEIYKIHGSIEDVETLVFTKQDYDEFEKNRRLIIAKMLTLFSDSPIIFLGYSLEDKNIRNIIYDFIECIDNDEISKLKSHFIFIEYKKDEKNLIETTENITSNRGNIPITKISTDNFTRLFRELNQITPGLPAEIVKKTRRLVKQIVENSRKTGDTSAVVINDDQLEQLSDDNIAIAFGTKSQVLGRHGYGSFDIVNLFEDILIDNFAFSPNMIISERLKSVARTQLIPIYKYYKMLSKEEKAKAIHMGKFLVRKDYESIYGDSYLKSILKLPEYSSIEEIECSIPEEKSENIDYIFKLFSRSIQNFSKSEIRDFCIRYFNLDKESCYRSTYWKRCVMYLDLIENYKKHA